jgi:hypothetical protein
MVVVAAYCRHQQRVVIQVGERHFAAVCGIDDLFDERAKRSEVILARRGLRRDHAEHMLTL